SSRSTVSAPCCATNLTRRPLPLTSLPPYTPLFRSPTVARRRRHAVHVDFNAVEAQRRARDCGCHRRAFRHHGDTRSRGHDAELRDRKSTRLNSSHVKTSYAVFCLKKKKKIISVALI